MRSRCLVGLLGPGRRQENFLTDSKGTSRMRNLPRSSGTWRGEVAKRHSVTVTPVSTAQHCIPRSLNSEIPSDVHVSMEEKDEGRMNPEPTELESPSAGTGLESPGQQYPPNEGAWETERTIADGYLLVGLGSNQGGDISSPTEHVGTRAGTATTPSNSSNAIFRKASRKPRNKTTSEENKQSDPGGKEEKPPFWNAAVVGIVFFLSWGELWAMGGSLFLLRVLCLCVSVCLFLNHCFIG